MNRSARAHRSTKIPNVKLRPAQRGLAESISASSSSSNKRSRQQDDLLDDREDAAHFRRLRDDGHDHGAHLDADFIGSSARPLKGAIISITGLSDLKPILTQYARELGARVEGNLTEDVTHLIADRPGSEKYRFALQLGMHIIRPDWILDVRQAWLAGDNVDAEQLEQQHQLPALSNITLCFSALVGAERRKFAGLAKELGATVSDELRFDGTITHLVSATADPNASSSVQHLLHFLDRARHGRNGSREQAASRILAVRPEWLIDCQQAGGCLDEAIYSIFAMLPDQRRRSALIDKARSKLTSPFIRHEEHVTLPFQSPFIASSRSKLTLAETDSLARNSRKGGADPQDVDDEQPITLGSRQKAAAAAEKSFDNILSQLRSHSNAFNTTRNTPNSESDTLLASRPDAPTSTSASLSTSAQPSALAPTSTSVPAPHNPHRNSLLRMSRASSFSPVPTAPRVTSLSMRKNMINASKLVTLPHSSQSSGSQQIATSSREGCFHAKTFATRLDDFHRQKVLEQVLRDNGATILRLDPATPPDFVVVDPKAPAASLRPLVDANMTPVLHFWIEYCLHHETFVEPKEYFAALPALVPQPLPDGEHLRLMLLGFDPDSPELYHAQKLVVEMGGSIITHWKAESLTHVVCATQESFEGKHAQHARSCGVPVVGLDFIIKARQSGRLLPPPVSIAITEPSSSALTTSSSSSSGGTATNMYSAMAASNEHHIHDSLVQSGPDLPLAGCTVSRTKALASQSVVLERKALQLGACWQAQASVSTTHLLHGGSGIPREAKELKTGVFLVHPKWLEKCIEQNIRVDESLFPSSMDPSRSLLTVLSSSDGSASGDFLSQASQNLLQHGTRYTQASQRTHAELIAAAKPWHRSISADATRCNDGNQLLGRAEEADGRHIRGRSEEITLMQGVGDEVGDADLMLQDAKFDADVTLTGYMAQGDVSMDADDTAPAPSSQTLFEDEEAAADEEIGEVRGVKSVGSETKDQAKTKELDMLKSAQKEMVSADKVIELLNRRTLASATRKKNRLPPRARKQRSDEEVKRSSGSTDAKLAPEKVLEAQARLDAQRAAEAAAQGYSLGMDKEVGLPPSSQTGQSFDASVRIVYDDPAAVRERTKLLKVLAQHQRPLARAVDDEVPADGNEDRTGNVRMERIGDAAHANGALKRGAEDTFGAARQSKAYWENRNSESPNKRPAVRRQPLARR